MASAFQTVFLEDVPVLSLRHLNQVRRLIVLVDTLYEHKVKLVVLAHAPPAKLFDYGDKQQRGADQHQPLDVLGEAAYAQKGVHDEVFAFDRTVSRLLEMQSVAYLAEVAGLPALAAVGNEALPSSARSAPASAACAASSTRSSAEAGVIVLDDLPAAAATSAAGAEMERRVHERLFRAYDVDGSGALEAAELEALLVDLAAAGRLLDPAVAAAAPPPTADSDDSDVDAAGASFGDAAAGQRPPSGRVAPAVVEAYAQLIAGSGSGSCGGDVNRGAWAAFAASTGLRGITPPS